MTDTSHVANRRIAIIFTCFNQKVTSGLLEGAKTRIATPGRDYGQNRDPIGCSSPEARLD
jgi:6,7-dimethyl-8-ribityllumazine synthase